MFDVDGSYNECEQAWHLDGQATSLQWVVDSNLTLYNLSAALDGTQEGYQASVYGKGILYDTHVEVCTAILYFIYHLFFLVFLLTLPR